MTCKALKINRDYPPLAEIRENKRVKWYRCWVDPKRLRELSERNDSQGWLQAGGHVALYLALASLCIVAWSQQSYGMFFLALWCTGFVATFFKGTAAHELGHGTVFKTRWLNRVFLYGVCLISWWDPFDYASSHTFHHRYTTHKKADRENVLPLKPSLHPWLILQLLTINLLMPPGRNFGKGGFGWNVYLTGRRALSRSAGHTQIPSQEWLESLHEDQPASFKASVIWSRVLVLFHSLVLLVAFATEIWILPLVISMPSFIANIGSYFLGTTQHCGLQENANDFRQNTRSLTLNPVMSFLYWHMNWHIEHHMYAGVPCYQLKALAKEIAHDMPKPRTVVEAWKEMRYIDRCQQESPNYRFETEVPQRNNQAHPSVISPDFIANQEEALVGSIGDLEPDGFNR